MAAQRWKVSASPIDEDRETRYAPLEFTVEGGPSEVGRIVANELRGTMATTNCVGIEVVILPSGDRGSR